MPPGLSHFAKNRRAGSPPGERNGVDRSAIGAIMKVQTRPNQGIQQQQHPHRHTAEAGGRPHPQHESPLYGQGPRRLGGQQSGGAVHHNAFDTDAESIDTTERGQNVYHPQDNHPAFDGEDPIDADSDFDDQHQEHEEDRGFDQSHVGAVFQGIEGLDRGTQQMVTGTIFETGMSYPSTTDGQPDSSFQHRDQAAPSEHYEEEREPSPTPERLHQGRHAETKRPLLEETPQRPASAPNPVGQMPHNLFGKSATIRQNQRIYAATPAHQPPAQHQPVSPPQSQHLPPSHPPTYSQVTRQEPTVRPNIWAPNPVPAPQPANTWRQNPTPHPAARSVPPPAAIDHHPRIPPEQEVAMAREDYDSTTLFKKKYSDLQNEPFDFDPQAAPHVLSNDMQRKPLPERLEHVRSSLEPLDQGKFFASLSASEWEASGDWFLEKCGAIIKNITQARQEKRKLATEFEAEIEKRHQHVAKRRQQVEDAIEDMRSSGQHLLQKSQSRTPRKGA